MSRKEFDWKNYHHGIYQFYHGFIALSLVPFALLFLSWDSGDNKAEVDYESFVFLATAQLLWLVSFLSWYVWKGKKVQYEITEDYELLEKLKEFKTKNLYKFMILTLAGVLSVLSMWIQPSFIFVLAYFAILIQFSFLRPSEDKIVRDMRLTKADRSSLHGQA